MSSLLCGSHREHPANSEPLGRPASEEIQITLLLRRRNPAPSAEHLNQHLSHAELAASYGASESDVEMVRAFATQHGLTIANEHPAARSVVLSGGLSVLADLFGAELEMRRVGSQVFRTRQGSLHMPDQLAGVIEAVTGFDQRPAAVPRHHRHPDGGVQERAAKSKSFTPPQVAAAYNFPTNTGKHQTIALIELGGGYDASDLNTYWKEIGISEVSVSAVSVDGAKNSPSGDASGPDGEVVLDIEVTGGVAPGAQIAVYFAPNTNQGFLSAINAAIHDRVRKPSVISISWGAAESEWTPQDMNAFNAAFHDAALLGISVCAAAGDDGSSDGESDGLTHVDFPASSPWVLACGGTNLVTANGAIKSETVWNNGSGGGATGGGVSSHFSKPAYQANINVPKPHGTANTTGRGVPDVAGVADPETGFVVRVDGEDTVIGGTSAVAPLWAGLIALFNEELGRNIGWLNGTLYGAIAQHGALHDIISGTNGSFKAAKGWDACTGLGTPNGQAILTLLKQKTK